MALSAGARLGPYEILAPLGAGGMGEVYRARDPKLGRDVALKVLPEGALTDESARRRFRAEADALSRISHPHIAAIYDFDSADGTDFLVMELVGGPSVRDRLEEKGPLPEKTVLTLGAQLARGLQAAHDEGIVHRDLKPSNLQLTPDGLIKILDFGLARKAPEHGDETAPTVSTGDQVAGTLAYMSPEQLKGEDADPRIDLYAAGAVLYEMGTGRRLHPGTNTAELIDAILNDEPPRPREANDRLSPGLEGVLLKALDKDPELRYQTARDLRVDLDRLQQGSGSVSVHERSASFEEPSPRGLWLPWTLATAAIAGFLLVSWAPWRSPDAAPSLRLDTELGEGLVFDGVALNKGPAAVLSPDGSQMAFVAREPGQESAIYVRPMSGLEPRRLPGTEAARSPFFSPDGEWIAFFAGGELKKVQVIGGAVVRLAKATNDRGGWWGDDGSIIFMPVSAAGVGLHDVPATGGEARTLTVPDPEAGETTHRWPQVLPDGRVLYTAHGILGGYDDASLVLESVPDGPRRIVHRGGYHGRYLRSGHLAFIHKGTLYAVPFDLERSETTGSPFVVAEGVFAHSLFAGAQFSASEGGSLAYVAGEEPTRSPILWLERDGSPTSLRDQPEHWIDPRLSPDGDRLALSIASEQSDIFVYDWTRDTLTRLTFDPSQDRAPVWTPDGRHLVFSSNRGSGVNRSLYWRPSDGSGETTRLTESEHQQYPTSWHPGGRLLAIQEHSPETGWDVRILEVEQEASGWAVEKGTTLVGTPAEEAQAAFSPDGRFLAYASTESGRYEVYVRPFPGSGGKWQVSSHGGTWPVWSMGRQEIVYQTETGTIMRAAYTVSESSFRSDQPRAWSETQCQWLAVNVGSFDVHPDGERVVVRPAGDARGVVPDSVVVVTSVFDELRRLQAEPGE